MPTTLQDIADNLNLSKSLVKGVLADRPGIWASPQNRQRIIDAASKMGYRPNLTARALATGRTHMIGLWINYLDDPHYAHILRCLQERVTDDKYQLVIRETSATSPVNEEVWDWPADGVIAVDCPNRVMAYRSAAGIGATPFVSLGVTHPPEVDRVHFDLLSGARQAMAQLIGTQRKSIALLCYGRAAGVDEPRRNAYFEAMTDAGLASSVQGSTGRYPADGRRAMEALLDRGMIPDAVFAEDDLLALGAYKALLDRGLRIPQDVALIGCDDAFGMDCLQPGVSSIHIPAQEGSDAAWKLLKRRIADPGAEIESVRLPTKLIGRASSEAAAHGGTQ